MDRIKDFSYPGGMKILLPDLNGFLSPLLSFLIKLPGQFQAVSDEIENVSYIHVSDTKNKNPESENNHITITNTFWSTELNSGPFLSHGVSICVSET